MYYIHEKFHHFTIRRDNSAYKYKPKLTLYNGRAITMAFNPKTKVSYPYQHKENALIWLSILGVVS